jgi:hypothetical protein
MASPIAQYGKSLRTRLLPFVFAGPGTPSVLQIPGDPAVLLAAKCVWGTPAIRLGAWPLKGLCTGFDASQPAGIFDAFAQLSNTRPFLISMFDVSPIVCREDRCT